LVRQQCLAERCQEVRRTARQPVRDPLVGRRR